VVIAIIAIGATLLLRRRRQLKLGTIGSQPPSRHLAASPASVSVPNDSQPHTNASTTIVQPDGLAKMQVLYNQGASDSAYQPVKEQIEKEQAVLDHTKSSR